MFPVNVDNLCVLLINLFIYSSCFTLDKFSLWSKVAYPSIAANGVLNSWETLATKSVLKVSMLDRASAIELKFLSISFTSFRLYSSSTLIAKFPLATSWSPLLSSSKGFKNTLPIKMETIRPRRIDIITINNKGKKKDLSALELLNMPKK